MADDIAPTYVVSDLLMYVTNKINSDTANDLKLTLNNFYCEEAVIAAKNTLWSNYDQQLTVKTNRRSKEKHIDDVVEGIRTIDSVYPDRSKLPVVFVATSLINLPTTRVQTENGAAIENRVKSLELQMKELLTNASTMSYSRVATANIPIPVAETTQGKTDVTDRRQTRQQTAANISIEQRQADVIPKTVMTQGVNGRRERATDEAPRHRSWTTVHYGKRKSEGLKAAPRRYEIVVFNVSKDFNSEQVKTYITDNNIDVLEIKRLSDEDRRVYSYQVVVLYKDSKTVLDGNFWPEDIGCRPYFRKRNDKQHVIR